MINCLLTVAQCTLITNHSAAENGIFQRNDLHQSSTILLMEEKRIPKKLEEAKDKCGIPSGGAGGARGREGSGAGTAALGGLELPRAPGLSPGTAARLLQGCWGEGNPTLCCGISPGWCKTG